MQKENWRKRWLSSINELTSIGLQRISWLDKENTNPHWSFVEFMCCYFDGLAINDNYKYQLERNWVTETEYQIILDWNSRLDKYEAPNKDGYEVVKILNDENWLRIVQIGEKVKERSSEKRKEQIVQSDILILYPNPTTGTLNVTMKDLQINIHSLEIFDLQGKKVFQVAIPEGIISGTSIQFDVSSLTSGLYLLIAKDGNGSRVDDLKFMKE